MMKKLKYLLAGVLVSAVAGCFVACDDDESATDEWTADYVYLERLKLGIGSLEFNQTHSSLGIAGDTEVSMPFAVCLAKPWKSDVAVKLAYTIEGDMPEEIQRRGFLKAGRLWCAGYWEAGGDLCEMQVKRVLGERRYRFFVWDTLPKNMFRVVSRHYPTLKFCLTALIKDDNSVLWDNELTLREYMIANGQYMGSYRRNETDAFAQIREGMGFQP